MESPQNVVPAVTEARAIRVRGVVQGVGFRPFVYRLARRYGLQGWVLNGEDGVDIRVEGPAANLDGFIHNLQTSSPPAARITHIDVTPVELEGFTAFFIQESESRKRPTVRISPDLPVCDDCLAELFDPSDRRYHYPYVNCTNCGPRYSIITALPYDRHHTTMREWPMCPDCTREYEDPVDRRFHAQPVACHACGPQYILEIKGEKKSRGDDAIQQAADLLRTGHILAVKGLGGYHLACDARNEKAVQALRQRKYRKEKPFALMARDLDTARSVVMLNGESEKLLTSVPRPIVLASAKEVFPGISPGNRDLGVMLPYTPLHHLLFEAGAPGLLVMTSANLSSEPIAYLDEDAFKRLGGLADAFLVGERPIARRVDDSVARVGPLGPVLLRRARGYAPGVVAVLPVERPILALGADLKNTITLVVEGQAVMSQYLGDLEHYRVEEAFLQTIEDLTSMYEVPLDEVLVVHDAHPQYRSTRLAETLPGKKIGVQHHRAHIASVLAEQEAWDRAVVGVAFDGTGYGDDGSIWGGEVFVGSLVDGLQRAAHLHPAALPGGDAAARFPVQAAAGFLCQLENLPDLTAPPFDFPGRFRIACDMVRRNVRTFPTTSTGRLFDTVAALLGYTRPVTFEGQAAIWLEHLARTSPPVAPYPFPDLDFRPLLQAIVDDRLGGRPEAESARAFHRALAEGVVEITRHYCSVYGLDTLVLSGGVFQNQLLLQEILECLERRSEDTLTIWTNHTVPPNDGGISLGQSALAAFMLDL